MNPHRKRMYESELNELRKKFNIELQKIKESYDEQEDVLYRQYVEKRDRIEDKKSQTVAEHETWYSRCLLKLDAKYAEASDMDVSKYGKSESNGRTATDSLIGKNFPIGQKPRPRSEWDPYYDPK